MIDAALRDSGNRSGVHLPTHGLLEEQGVVAWGHGKLEVCTETDFPGWWRLLRAPDQHKIHHIWQIQPARPENTDL